MYIVEYSKSQNAFHLSDEKDTLEQEIKTYEETGWIGDWEVLGRFKTREEARDFLKPIKAIRDESD